MTKADLITVAAFVGIMAIPIMLGAIAILRLFKNRPNDADESDLIVGDYAINAQWPSDSLSREFEQEPRGM